LLGDGDVRDGCGWVLWVFFWRFVDRDRGGFDFGMVLIFWGDVLDLTRSCLGCCIISGEEFDLFKWESTWTTPIILTSWIIVFTSIFVFVIFKIQAAVNLPLHDFLKISS